MTEKHQSSRRRSSNVDNRLTDLEQQVQGQHNELKIQFQRIAQLQVEVDRLRTGTLGAESRHADPTEEHGPLFVPYVADK